MLDMLKRAFRPLDTSEVDAAISRAADCHRGVCVRARALRMDVSCGVTSEAVQRIARRVGAGISRHLNSMNPPIYEPHPDIEALLGKLSDGGK